MLLLAAPLLEHRLRSSSAGTRRAVMNSFTALVTWQVFVSDASGELRHVVGRLPHSGIWFGLACLGTKLRARYTPFVKFEWDPKKAAQNLRTHRVSFDEASTAFGDWHSVTVPDPEHSSAELRYYLLGMSDRGRLLVVCHTDRGEVTRIFSAWRANARQRRQYAKKER